ncbi:ice-binding family protein [Cryobacterium sp. CG_9.6]|uniref:ice-binding family protein n=1 Tax=Cryobacterium sp. CG_9.6 TaxID=2760710 RepID=UPI00247689BB|nr:ice-binding family protein [Cryobacterium sp. CG_9.6]MDH6237636.1 hypothetical protein [Cryobacterium sp. CG_9.6]
MTLREARRHAAHGRRFSARRPARAVGLATVLVLILTVTASPFSARAANDPINLRTAAGFSVLAGASIASTAISTMTGSIGTSPGVSITGFPPGVVSGDIHPGDAVAAVARNDAVFASIDAANRVPTGTIAGDIGGATLFPGVHRSVAALSLSTTLTLDGQGDPQAVFIFQIGAAMGTAAASTVTLINGARAANVFWQVVGAVSLGAASSFSGTILGQGAVSVGANTRVTGRAIALTDAVALNNNTFIFEPVVLLRSAASCSVLAGTFVTNTGATVISGNVGTSPTNSVTGFPPGLLTGVVHAGDATAAQARVDLQRAYDDAGSRDVTHRLAGDLSGRTLTAGVYRADAALTLTDTLIIDGQNNPNGVFIFQLAAGITTAPASEIRLINFAQASQIFWRVSGPVTLGGLSRFTGSILSTESITIGRSAQLLGRALTLSGSVTLNTSSVGVTPTLDLGTASTYALLSNTSVANTGVSVVTGDVGTSPGVAVTGFPPGVVNGTIHVGDAAAAQAVADTRLAYQDALTRAPDAPLAGDLAGQTIRAGVYRSDAAVSNSGAFTLDGQGNPNGVFIFQIEAALSAAAASSMVLTNGAQASRVFWQVLGAATIGAGATFQGTILGDAAISIGAGAVLTGAALTAGGAIALNGTEATVPPPLSGSLSAVTSGFALSDIALTGVNTQFVSATATPWVVADARGTGAEWGMTVSASSPISAPGTVETVARMLPSGSLVLAPGGITAKSGADPALGIITTTLALTSVGQTLIAAPGPHRGTYSFTPSFSVTIPANAYRSNFSGEVDNSPLNPYVSILTITIG